MLSGSPLAVDKLSVVRSQYFVGITPPLMQFKSMPLSISAIALTEMSSTTNVTIEYHF